MPMDLFEALSTTRAVRRFTGEPISAADIMTCIRAATQAPSGGNIQPWQFLVVTDAAMRRALGQVYRRAYQDEVRTICGIPERYEIVALVPMGRPVRPFRVGRRRPAERVTHWDRFGAKRG